MAVINPDEYYSTSLGYVPRSLNQKVSIAIGHTLKGGFNFPYLEAPAADPTYWDTPSDGPTPAGEAIGYLPPYRTAPGLLDLHPNRMVEQMAATVKIGFKRVTVVLSRNPDFISIGDITSDNWNEYWSIISEFIPDNAQITEFAEDYDGSLPGLPEDPDYPKRPPYDSVTGYPAGAESLWEDVEDTSRHRWYRISYLDYDETDTPIVGYITPPIPRSQGSTTFVREVNYFKRNGTKTGSPPLSSDRPDRPPAFTSSGVPNNSPTGWSDSVPAAPATDYLWKITALQEADGNIITSQGWSVPQYVKEDVETVRYSNTGKPNPDTIVGPTEDVATGSNEANLVAAGWVPSADFDPSIHFYIATRTGSSGSWTNWKVERIIGESGVQRLRKYKLYPILTDYDDPTWQAAETPTTVDPAPDGWVDYLSAENNFEVNFVIEGAILPDGSFLEPWSAPRPFTSVPTYADLIQVYADDGGIDLNQFEEPTFRSSFTGGVENHDPEDIWLRAELYKGAQDVYADTTITITQKWYKIYNDNAFIPSPAVFSTARQHIVNNADVIGRAIYRVEMILDDAGLNTKIQDAITAGYVTPTTLLDGTNETRPVFIEEISVRDFVDGLDGRALSASATQSRFLLDTTPTPDELLPAVIIVRAEVDNVDKNDVEWDYLNGTDPTSDPWVQITATSPSGVSTPAYTYVDTENNLVLVGGDVTTATDIFTLVGSNDVYVRARVDASGSLTALEDWVMVSKVDAGAIVSGEAAFDVYIENPLETIRVDALGTPLAGELSDVIADIEVRKGATVQTNSAFTVTCTAVTGGFTNTAWVTITQTGGAGGTKTRIELDEPSITWTTTETKAIIELTVTFGAETKKVYMQVATVLEPEGFTGLDITSSDGNFDFYTYQAGDSKTITAQVVQNTGSGLTPVAGFDYKFTISDGNYDGNTSGHILQDSNSTDLVLDQDKVNQFVQVTVLAYPTGVPAGPPLYTTDFRINDLPDNRVKILYNSNDHDTLPSTPGAAYDTYPGPDPGGGGWYRTTDSNAVWYSNSYDGGLTWDIPRWIAGKAGEDGVGVPGADGADGAQILYGTGAPAGGLGEVGDTYIATDTGNVYSKTGASTWTLKLNIIGDDGADGDSWDDPAWIQLSPSWTVYYRKDLKGIVHMRGGGLYSAGVLGNLPAGYRPDYTIRTHVTLPATIGDGFGGTFVANIVAGEGRIETGGNVVIQQFTSTPLIQIGFDGISFEGQ